MTQVPPVPGVVPGVVRGVVRAVLFDLDGTLIDSAPDLAGTLNDMRHERGLAPWSLQALRAHCGSGARGMLGEGLQARPGDVGYEALRQEFLDRYEQRMLAQTQVFEAVPALLAALQSRGLPWGIVTNKAMRFVQPMVQALGLISAGASALVAGDSTPHTKPHPAPLLEAARRVAQPPQACVYVGDDPRDVTAGRAAGMATLVAGWGYTQAAPHPVDQWGAHAVLTHPKDLLHWLDLA